MNRRLIPTCIIVMTMLMLPAVALGEDACCPADDIAAGEGATAAGALPQGHPPVGSQMPAGHPPVGNAGMSGMPAGHPPIASDQYTPALGTLIVKAVQATRGGETVAGHEVTVDLYQRDTLLTTLKGKIDEHGAATFENVKIPGNAQPVVRLVHAGVAYQNVGQMMTAQHPDQIVRVMVYDVTDQPPDWRITMRHVMLHAAADGLHVVEVIAVENPTDKAWRGAGEGVDDAHDNGGPTVTFNLPEGAADIELGEGFHACCTKAAGGQIVHAMPLLPGLSRFQFSYTLRSADGRYDLDLKPSAPTARLSVFIPDDGAPVEAVGLEEGKPMQAGQGVMRYYLAQQVQPGDAVRIGLALAVEPSVPSVEAPPESAGSARTLAGVGMVTLLAAAGVVLLVKPRKTGASPHGKA